MAATRTRFADFSQWLVPALGCFLLVVGTLSSRYPAHPDLPLAATNFLTSENGSAYSEMVIASRADHSDINSLPAGRLEWSFGRRSSGTDLGTLPISYTNKIIQ